jgi:hypothetical protein
MKNLRTKNSNAGVAIATLAGILAACGCDNGERIDDLVGDYNAAQCGMFARCHLASDLAYCMAQGMMSDVLAAKVAAALAGKLRYDGNAARACLDAWASEACDAWQGTELSISLSSSCSQIFSGGFVADGAPCTTDQECVSGSACVVSNHCPGICTSSGSPIECVDDSQCPKGRVCASSGACLALASPAPSGQPCDRLNPCKPGLYCCQPGYCSPTSVCLPLVTEGGDCGSLNDCADGLICATASSGQHSTCMKLAAKNEACQAPTQCGGLFMSSLTCDMTLQVCVDNPSSGPCGAEKLWGDGCDESASYCDRSASPPTCKGYAAIGDPCTPGGSSSQCGRSGTCQLDSTGTTGTCAATVTCTP